MPRPHATMHATLAPLNRRWLTGIALTLLCGWASAQAVYRIVGPDGKVTFSDRPPPAGTQARAAGTGAAAAPDSPALPYALQQVAGRFPVTLYTASDCAPCASARNLLVTRGIPFTERTIATNEDIDALQRLSGDTNLPFGTIGSQQLKGFADVEWTQYLDAAGYPRTSQLPANYRRPAATPLVAVRAAPQPPAATTEGAPSAAAAPTPAPAPARAPANPAGITF